MNRFYAGHLRKHFRGFDLVRGEGDSNMAVDLNSIDASELQRIASLISPDLEEEAARSLGIAGYPAVMRVLIIGNHPGQQ